MMTDRTISRLRVAQRIVYPILGVSFATYALQAFSQIEGIKAAGQISDKLQNASLAQGCIYVTALSIAAVCYMARLMFLVMQQEAKEKEERLKRAETHNRFLTEKLLKQHSDGVY